MKTILKSAVIAGVAGVLALSAMTPSQARDRWVGPAAGFAAGAVVGAAAANANAAYYNGYGYNDPYDAPAPVYADPGYAYAPAYPAPGYSNYSYHSNNTTDFRDRQLTGKN